MATIVTLGSATHDIFLLRPNEHQIKRYVVDHAICMDEGTKNAIEKIHYAIGGGAINAAVSLHNLGHEVVPCCMVGCDDAGKFIIRELRNKGISTDAIFCDEEHSTGISCIITCHGCDSILLVYRGANNYIEHNFTRLLHEAKSLLSVPFWYCGPISGDAAVQLSGFLATIRPLAKLIAINPGAFQLGAGCEQFMLALPYIDIIMLNAREARTLAHHMPHGPTSTVTLHDHYDYGSVPPLMRSLSQDESMISFARSVMHYGPRIIVITDGAHGAYVIDEHHVYFHPSLSVDVLNTVGAGDAFSSTFFSYLIEGETIASALSRAMINSAAVLCSVDATDGLLTAQELQKRYERQGTGNVLEFTYEETR